ncbi:MAG: hypothetical protein HUJ26_16465, partial [Planctomycetaceae bacterium]|nr:hypothetical protein [Planctomycetaceae bacterium]
MTSDSFNNQQKPNEQSEDNSSSMFTRRKFLVGSGLGMACSYTVGKALWNWNEGFLRATTFVGAMAGYGGNLSDLIEDGLKEIGWTPKNVRQKSVLLKPSLVETIPGAEHLHTHPFVVQAVAETFRRWDAKEVFVAEGP